MWGWVASPAWAAEPLYVEEERADEVAAAVEALWPGDHLVVQLRPESVDAGFVWDGARLLRVADGRVTWGDAPDPETAVVLARAWSREAPVPEPPPAPPPEPARPPPTPLPPPPRRAPRALVTLGLLDVADRPYGLGGALGIGGRTDAYDVRGIASARAPFQAPVEPVVGLDAVIAVRLAASRRVRGGAIALGGAGAELRISPPTAVLAPAVQVGIGADGWIAPRFGVRTAVSVRQGYGGLVWLLSSELLFAVGSKDSARSAQPRSDERWEAP